MVPLLPVHLIHSILFLSAALADEASPGTLLPDSPPALSEPPPCPATLWEVGFSLRQQWGVLQEQEACPLESDDGDSGSPIAPVDPTAPILEQTSTVDLHRSSDTLEDEFVGFEEWKQIRMAQEAVVREDELLDEDRDDGIEGIVSDLEHPSDTRHDHSFSSLPDDPESNLTVSANDASTTTASSSLDASESVVAKPPSNSQASSHSRYDYASLDCSARIQSSSPQTQHASSLLHKSRDRYMLTPCKADQHWVAVELCDEIRIEAIEIAIWEFFSGIVREVRISVGGEPENDDSSSEQSMEWEEVGVFFANNVRGVQSFTLPYPTSFHRFLRLDFPSYYGTEYYCPVSHLKVFGMNQMEAFKWEQKQLTMKGKEKANRDRENEETAAREREEDKVRREEARRRHEMAREKELGELELIVQLEARRSILSHSEDVHVTAEPVSSPLVSTKATPIDLALTSTTNTSDNDTDIQNGVESPTSEILSSVNTSQNTPSASLKTPSPRSDSSESIYAFITRRINDLEGNSTLIARYIEEQSRVMRYALGRLEREWDDWQIRRIEEDRGRWEQERMRQEDRFGKIFSQMEQQRAALEHDRRFLASQLRVLSDELTSERRRGIAQLCVMITIIGLGVVSRGNAIDAVLKPLVAEARRRRSDYGRDKRYGPLAGLRIDLGADRPPAVIGQGRPKMTDADVDKASTPIATYRMRPRGVSTARRPTTPNPLRQRKQLVSSPDFRSISATDHGLPNADGATFPRSPRPRGSLPPLRHQNGTAQRRLAHSSHLHSIEVDKMRRQQTTDGKQINALIGVGKDAEEDNVEGVLEDSAEWGTAEDRPLSVQKDF